MTDQSPEPADPWALPDRPAVDRGGQQSTPGVPGAQGGRPPSVHDQPTITGMPGAGVPQPQQPQPQQPQVHQTPPATPAYGYPAQPAYGYGYPAGYPSYVPMRNGFGVTALVLGIISAVMFCTSFIAVAIGITAVVFGILGRGRVTRGEADNGGVALAGIILGAVGIVVGALLAVVLIVDIVNRADTGTDRDSGGSEYDAPYSNSQVLHRG
ncbi:DUF4190 domain-containing protein [Streptomyces sp. NPDC002054]|uniref:DUF4190 domain-containing protein n=1 Tax=Streptomyces sp. NPDC002054 TaxID=3154663 RepID=UPI003317BEFA